MASKKRLAVELGNADVERSERTKKRKIRRVDDIFDSQALEYQSDGYSQSEEVEEPDLIGASEVESDEEGPVFVDELPERVSLPSRAKIRSQPTQRPSPMEPTPIDVAEFVDLGISTTLIRSLKSMSINQPTPVQAACIPPLLAGHDCIGNAKTGSGKTIAFAVPILQKLSSDPYGIYALVLTPTRELAFQISEQFAVLGSSMNIRTSVVVGGMDMMTQALELKNRPHVIVATPGRLVDHMNSGGGEWSLGRVKFLVLDEADRLLTSTFAPDLRRIFGELPPDRQTGLFTATLTPSIEALANADPRPGKSKPIIHRDTSKVETVESLKQHYLLVPSHVREVYLYHLLCNPPESILHLRREPPATEKTGKHGKSKRRSADGADEEDDVPKQPPPTIIFVRHPRTASYLTTLLQHLEIRSTALHSHLSQPARLASLQLFRASVVPVMVCTDVASRGLDMEGVGMVINWDMPSGKARRGPPALNADSIGQNSAVEDEDDVGGAEEYVHRVGRTARMGKGGVAVSFITERDEDAEMMKKIEARIHTQLTELTLPEQKVLEKLNLVSTAKRTAHMTVQESDFGKRQEINRVKRKKRADA